MTIKIKHTKHILRRNVFRRAKLFQNKPWGVQGGAKYRFGSRPSDRIYPDKRVSRNGPPCANFFLDVLGFFGRFCSPGTFGRNPLKTPPNPLCFVDISRSRVWKSSAHTKSPKILRPLRPPLPKTGKSAPKTKKHPDGPFGRPGARRAAAPCKRWCFAVPNSRHRSCVRPRPKSPIWDPQKWAHMTGTAKKVCDPGAKAPIC